MDAEQGLPDAPSRVPGWYAVHGPRADDEPTEPIAEFDDGAIRVFKGEPPTAGGIGPVYADVEGGPPVVPTGRALVRFADGERAAERASDLEAAGFEVDEVLSYAPQAAWVRPSSGQVADAVDRLSDLAAIEGVVHVEPQLLREMARKERRGGASRRSEPRAAHPEA